MQRFSVVGHFFGEFLQGVQIFMVEAGKHFPFDELSRSTRLQTMRLLVDRAADGYFDDVVVAVSVGLLHLPYVILFSSVDMASLCRRCDAENR